MHPDRSDDTFWLNSQPTEFVFGGLDYSSLLEFYFRITAGVRPCEVLSESPTDVR